MPYLVLHFFSIVKLSISGEIANIGPAFLWGGFGYFIMSKGCAKNKTQNTTSKKPNNNPTEIKYSLSAEGETVKDYGRWNVHGEDIQLQSEPSPSKIEFTTPNPSHIPSPNPSSVQKSTPPQSIYKYCSQCGEIIHPVTKKCTGCGKQYFKGVPWKTVICIVLSVLLAVSVFFNIDLLTKRNELVSEKIQFFDTYVVFVEDDGTNLYHKYDCKRFKGNSFWAYNLAAADDNGYRPCPLCCD